MKYSILIKISAVSVFVIALIIYTLTLESTSSFWDCGEFIACAYTMGIPHPPGAPLFTIIGRLFTMLAPDPEHIAWMVNFMSGLSSALAVMFLFLSITMLSEKIIKKEKDEYSLIQQLLITGSGAIGALSFAFSDSFWFSAVEGEVYAMSSLFTAMIVWSILKWKKVADEDNADRWLVFTFFITGLSFGVHLLNLLVIPFVIFVIYFKKYSISTWGIIKTSLLSLLVLGIAVFGFQVIISLAIKFEITFVNSFGLPFNSGSIFFFILFFLLIIYGIHYSHRKEKPVLNKILLCFLMVVLGYSSFFVVVIRSGSNPSLDSNNPDNLFGLLSYLNREQYPQQPLLFGPYYNAPIVKVNDGKAIYKMKKDKYEIVGHIPEYEYDPRFTTFFPRMYSGREGHPDYYKNWVNIEGKKVDMPNNQGEQTSVVVPTFGENLLFFFRYQLGYMYFRYLLWNFAGRQDDIQGRGDALHGNWISGINFIDEIRLGNQDKVPSTLSNNNARNKYYLIPFILGIIGIFYYFRKGNTDAWNILILFLSTGIAVVLYVNEPPMEPRERDYSYVSSFYVFSFWIGMSVLSIYEYLRKRLSEKISLIATLTFCTVFVPVIMAKENWNDHDRSGRYIMRDLAVNYLNSCAPNAIIFTNADNDTYPLWNVQNVEGVRKDIRIVCLPYFSAEWYIKQMKLYDYQSKPLPISFTNPQIEKNSFDAVYMTDKITTPVNLKDMMEFVKSDSSNPPTGENQYGFFPSRKLDLPVDKERVIKSGTVRATDIDKIVDKIEFTIKDRYISKNHLMILDILANNNWERPIYFTSIGNENTIGLDEYFQLDGFAYRLVPIKTPGQPSNWGRIDVDTLYDKLMNKFKWGRMNEKDVYLDENIINMTKIMAIRNVFLRLAQELINQDKKAEAKNVLDRCLQIMPNEKIAFDISSIGYARAYFVIGEQNKGRDLIKQLTENAQQDLDYYISINEKSSGRIDYEKKVCLYTLTEIKGIAEQFGQKDLADSLIILINDFYSRLNIKD